MGAQEEGRKRVEPGRYVSGRESGAQRGACGPRAEGGRGAGRAPWPRRRSTGPPGRENRRRVARGGAGSDTHRTAAPIAGRPLPPNHTPRPPHHERVLDGQLPRRREGVGAGDLHDLVDVLLVALKDERDEARADALEGMTTRAPRRSAARSCAVRGHAVRKLARLDGVGAGLAPGEDGALLGLDGDHLWESGGRGGGAGLRGICRGPRRQGGAVRAVRGGA